MCITAMARRIALGRTARFVCQHASDATLPGSGAPDEKGAFENIINLPLAPETDGQAMRTLYRQTVLPHLRAFQPDLLIISAGFDAHASDPLAQLNWRVEDFAWLTQELCAAQNSAKDGGLGARRRL